MKNEQARLKEENAELAQSVWPGELGCALLKALDSFSTKYRFSIALGDLLLLDRKWYVTHAGLLRTAQRRRCHGIRTSLQKDVSDPIASRWVFKATVYKTPLSRGFVGYGDAEPSNVSSLVRGAEMRVAETRAVNRALRKAYGIGVCSVEELGYLSSPAGQYTKRTISPTSNETSSSDGQPRLRDRLCLLIRQHQLDPALVKRYAADFCGTQELRAASRDLASGGALMKCHFPGLHLESKNGNGLLEGLFLARVVQASYRWHREKPFFSLQFSILEPKQYASHTLSGRLYWTPKALWKLNWFLRDFGYDHELFIRDEVDEKALLGLTGVVKTSRTALNGRSFLNLEAFAPAGNWEELAASTIGNRDGQENGDDL